MNKFETFEQFLVTQSVQLPLLNYCINLILAALLAYLVGQIYIRYGHAISNRRGFARNLVLLAMTTMVVISIVKSSLALSLGLVGALSIVRFRTAIKEPEELAYLFIAITIGLGLGADQLMPTIIAVGIILGVIVFARTRKGESSRESNLYLTISSSKTGDISLGDIVAAVDPHATELTLKRYDESSTDIEVVFHVLFDSMDQLGKVKDQLMILSSEVSISLIDQQGIVR